MAEQSPLPSERPGPDQLAGVYILVEGEEQCFVTGPASQTPRAREEAAPTREDLAGITLFLEGNEQVLVPDPGPSSEPPS